MKITCTKQEKADLVEILTSAAWCYSPEEDCESDMSCSDCIECHIEWEITDGEQE